MLETVRVLLALSLLWCLLATTVQVLRARGGGRTEFSRASGSPLRGVYYNFTTAMLPSHKESVRLHPGKFAAGALLHVGVLLSLVAIVVLLLSPSTGLACLGWLRIPAAVSLVAGLYLLIRRLRDDNLRVMSAPDDYLAILVSCGLVALVALLPVDAENQVWLLSYATLLFAYFPLGKLRHAVFFFIARADLGYRLGHRGVYPPPTSRVESR